jgi:hypothetical protein
MDENLMFDWENPVAKPDPRFDPADDAENQAAHEDDPEIDSEESMDEEEIQTIVRTGMERAVAHFEENIEPDLKKATDYYMARPFGDEEDGRSKVVSSDVRDATLAQVPSLMRIFFGPEHAVEFKPRAPGKEDIAEQMTDYVNYVISEDNPGFLTFHSVFKDALIRRLGIVKFWWDELTRVEGANYSGLGDEELLALQLDESTESFEVTGERLTEDGTPIYDVRSTRRRREGRVRIAAIPPEEIVWTPDARSAETAPLIAHVRNATREELIAVGIDEELIDEAIEEATDTASDSLDNARRIGADRDRDGEDRDISQHKVLYSEVYARIDADGDGIAELRLFRCVGLEYEIAGDPLGEIVDEIPFAFFWGDPEPHAMEGLGNFDLLKDVQRVKSQILRGTLNSLSQAVEPQMEVVTGEVNMKDVLDPEISGIIRVTKPGMLREIKHQFVGAETLPMLEHYDRIKEERTGQTKASQGLDADSLQSATKAAVAATLSAAQQRVEMIARVLAETGMKRLFQGVLQLVVRHQDEARVIRLRNEYVRIDPRHWNTTLDVQINVALGAGTTEEKITILTGIIAKQEELLQQGSPLVSNVEYRNTLGRLIELAGFRNSAEFFKPWGPQEEMELQQKMAQQPPQPDPAQLLVEVEKMKAEAQAMIDQARLEMERWKITLQDDRERDKLARETALQAAEMELKYQTAMNQAQLSATVEMDRAAMDADIEARFLQQERERMAMEASQRMEEAQMAQHPGEEAIGPQEVM